MVEHLAKSVQSIDEIPVLVAGLSRILILGGIREAVDLAAVLVAQGHSVITSLAGRTKEPAPLAGKVRVGGFGGAAGLAAYLEGNDIDVLIDATHPFAETISTNAVVAANKAGRPLIVYCRAAWQKQAGDHWIEVETLAEARDAIPAGARVLLALGSQHIVQFATRDDVHFVVRMVDAPAMDLPFSNCEMVLGKPGDTVAETQLLMLHRISHIVCRNSGGLGAYAKIGAARQLQLPVIIVHR